MPKAASKRELLKILPEKGDLVVILSMLLLAWMFFHPLLKGRRLSNREDNAVRNIQWLMEAVTMAGMQPALASIDTALAARPELSPYGSTQLLPRGLTHALQKDNQYAYQVEASALLSGQGICIVAYPRRSDMNAHVYGMDTDAEIFEESLANRGDGEATSAADIEAEKSAKKRIELLGRLILAPNLKSVFAKLRQLVLLHGFKLDKPKASDAKSKMSRRHHTVLLEDGNYYFLPGIIYDEKDKLRFTFEAWPMRKGDSGYAALHARSATQILQTINMKRIYDGRRSQPAPGAGEAKLAARANFPVYVGWDGNRWQLIGEQ